MVPDRQTTRSPLAFVCAAALLTGDLALAVPVEAQNAASGSPALQISRADEPPKLEWFVGGNGAARREGVAVTDFRQREPGDGTPVSQSTAAFLSYDNRNLYV